MRADYTSDAEDIPIKPEYESFSFSKIEIQINLNWYINELSLDIVYSLVRELELKRLMKEVVDPEYEACGKFSYSLRALEF